MTGNSNNSNNSNSSRSDRYNAIADHYDLSEAVVPRVRNPEYTDPSIALLDLVLAIEEKWISDKTKISQSVVYDTGVRLKNLAVSYSKYMQRRSDQGSEEGMSSITEFQHELLEAILDIGGYLND